MAILNILLGGSLLAWGRKLFWLFVGAAGFFTGWQIAQAITKVELVGIVVGVVFAVAGFFLARFLKTVAIGIGGFLMGGAILFGLSGFLNLNHGMVGGIIYLIGGVGGVILINMFFDWALIVLSTLGGAVYILQGFGLQSGFVRLVLFVGLVVFGIIFQGRQLAREKKTNPKPPRFNA